MSSTLVARSFELPNTWRVHVLSFIFARHVYTVYIVDGLDVILLGAATCSCQQHGTLGALPHLAMH